jgi:hypothetical protein
MHSNIQNLYLAGFILASLDDEWRVVAAVANVEFLQRHVIRQQHVASKKSSSLQIIQQESIVV